MTSGAWVPPVDIYQNGDHEVVLKAELPDMTREARTEQRAALIATVPRGFRYAILIVAPALAGLITCGAPLIHALLPSSLSAAEVHTLQVFAALLVPWTLAALLVNFLLPVLLALGRARLLGALALPLVAIHIAATALGTALFGVDGAVGAFFVAPACLAAVLLVAGAQRVLARALGEWSTGDHDHDFSAWRAIDVIRRELGDRSAPRLLELLGELARHHRPPRAGAGASELGQRIGDPRWRLIYDTGMPQNGYLVHRLAPLGALSRQKPEEGEGLADFGDAPHLNLRLGHTHK